MSAYHAQILDAYEDVIQGLDLNNTQSRVYKRMTLMGTWTANVEMPCIVLSPVGLESVIESSAGKDNVGYPITVRIVDRAGPGDEPIAHYLQWRYVIRNAFHLKRLTGVATVHHSLFQPGPTLEPEALAYQLLVMPLIFQVVHQEVR